MLAVGFVSIYNKAVQNLYFFLSGEFVGVCYLFLIRCCPECIVFSVSGFQLLDSDQELYKNFPLVISERWQQEVAETVYEAVNSDTDKNETRKRAKNKQQGHEEGEVLIYVHR